MAPKEGKNEMERHIYHKGIFAANGHNIRETDKKNGIFRPYIQGESLQFQKKNIHLPILIGKFLRKTSPRTLAP